MCKKTLSLLVFLCFCFFSKAQVHQYIIELKDKAGSPYSIDNPEVFLSQRALDRRSKQNIAVVENDLPVNPNYLDSIRSSGDVTIKNTSRWLNQVCIETSDEQALQKIASFSFVKNSGISKRLSNREAERRKFGVIEQSLPISRIMKTASELSYGGSENQVKIHNGDFLHDKGFRGGGMLISIIDAGFYHYKTLPAFDSVRFHNRILDTYDFVANKTDVNNEHSHGMQCFSIIAANDPGKMIGTAPDASFLLYRSENAVSESRSEEQNWIAALERSDSAGADIVNTSLGYNTFDNNTFDYTYQDMNGQTSLMAKAAYIAASKGMLLVIAAGNEGNQPWRYITTPGDALDVLTVGAVNVDSVPGTFSSYGPSADGRVKPDVASVGHLAYIQTTSGGYTSGNGTSYATPNLAGLVACLWQAFPDLSSFEIMDVVKKSGHKYSNPDNRVGYGIPDFEKAYYVLADISEEKEKLEILNGQDLIVYPNPVVNSSNILIKVPVSGKASLKWYDASGRLVFMQTENLNAGEINSVKINRSALARGIYVLKLVVEGKKFQSRIVID